MADTPTNHKVSTLINGAAQYSGALGVNGKAPQTAVTAVAAATDLPTTLTLVNQIRTALIAMGIMA